MEDFSDFFNENKNWIVPSIPVILLICGFILLPFREKIKYLFFRNPIEPKEAKLEIVELHINDSIKPQVKLEILLRNTGDQVAILTQFIARICDKEILKNPEFNAVYCLIEATGHYDIKININENRKEYTCRTLHEIGPNKSEMITISLSQVDGDPDWPSLIELGIW